MNEKYSGRRFAFAVLCSLLLTAAFFFGTDSVEGTAKFGQFALYLSGIFGVYCTGQSFTDHAKLKNGESNG